MSTVTDKLAGLSPAQIQAIAARLAARTANLAAGPKPSRIPRLPRDGRDYALSMAQERLWFQCQLNPDSAAYNIPLAVHLQLSPEHDFDPDAVRSALVELSTRHESLRTVLEVVDGAPRQRLAPEMAVPVVVQDVRGVSATEREAAAVALLQADAQRPFDLRRGPLFRLLAVRMERAEWMLLINSHHVVSDSWSLGVLLREMTMVATARRAGGQVPLPPLPVQPVDHAAWERDEVQGERTRDLLAWWSEQLEGDLPILKLPFARRGGGAAQTGAAIVTVLDSALTQAVDRLAREEATTPFNVLLAGYKLLLQRLTRTDDVIVGTPTANRTLSEMEGLIGCFINTLVLRTDLSKEAGFRETLRRVATTTEGAVAHGDCPFELLVAHKRPDRNHPPLIQTLFTMQNAPIDSAVPGGRLSMIDLSTGGAKFELALSAQLIDGCYRLSWSFRSDLYASADIESLAASYTYLLSQLLARPDAATGDHPLTKRCDPAPAIPDFVERLTPFDRRFDAEALRCPDAPALDSEAGELSYAALRRRSNALAAVLGKAGVRPGDVVPIALGRTPSAVVALLAVLKAGAAYLPMDTAWPPYRITEVCRIAGARHAIVGADLVEALPAGCIATPHPACGFTEESEEAPLLSRSVDDVAYVIFTSGSTGVPKGVVVTHRQLGFYVESALRMIGLPAGTRYAALATQAADLGHTATFPALAAGGTLVLTDEAALLDPERLAATWFRSRPDVLKIVPSHLASLLDVEAPGRILPRKTLVFGGEVCPAALVARVHAIAPELRIINHYGPTETTVGVIAGEVDPAKALSKAWAAAPLGRAFPGVHVTLRDAHGHLAPEGWPGEIYIGGPSVSQGYIGDGSNDGRPQFQPDSTDAGSAGRLYRTGDLARPLADGSLYFLGRVDDQVKVRGMRIEPAEVEAAINLWPRARGAVVKVVEEAGGPVLAAWVAVGAFKETEQRSMQAALQSHLRSHLPAGLVPALLNLLTDLPRASNGKLDRATPHVVSAAALSAAPPRSALELDMLRVWEQVLPAARIGVDDDFFEVGGHSLLAIKLITLIRRRFEVTLPLATFLQNRTIARICRILAQEGPLEDSETIVQLRGEGSKPPLFFVHPAGGNVLCYYDLAQALAPDRAFYALQAAAFDADEVPSIEAMAAEYVAAVLRVRPQGPFHLGGWSMGGAVAFEMARQLQNAGREVAMVLVVDTPAPGQIDADRAGQVDEVTSLAIYARKLELFSGASFGLDSETLRALPEAERTERLLGAMRLHNMVPDEVTAPQLAALVALQRRHNTAILNYRPGVYDGPVALVRASESFAVPEEAALLALGSVYATECLGWGSLVPSLSISKTPGDHISMMTRPLVTTTAAALDAVLDQREAAAAPKVLEALAC